ncbi:hypothetical protein EBB56_09250 [Halomonas sp. YLB-10]|uniref:hypothetical protein n=1 Tax=Halomonas sp. YLB-10 TaxID=2483111 RepID=UPI000F5F3269|nr:hypothetical protein [Halomonas sp. YLB-10]RQW71336.1 hypothetical protein EBB56_09250 [Halomonas sp. YLB-10]
MRIWDINPADQTVIDPDGRDCPLDPMSGQPKVPGNAMTEFPPATGENEAAKVIDGAWQVVPDWRGHVYWLADGSRHEITELGVEPPTDALGEAPPEPIADAAMKAIARVNAGYTQAMATILVEYPDAETLSFDKQEREARTWSEWQENGGIEPATPYLDAMLDERPIGKGELVTRILAKADAFVAAHGAATGRRQRLEDEIGGALLDEDRGKLESISW